MLFQEKTIGGVAGTNPDTGEKVVMTASDSSHKSTTSAQLKDESDFVMVELVSFSHTIFSCLTYICWYKDKPIPFT